jgi:hypothetical protein
VLRYWIGCPSGKAHEVQRSSALEVSKVVLAVHLIPVFCVCFITRFDSVKESRIAEIDRVDSRTWLPRRHFSP